jgi:hypothetical protein
MAKIAKKRILPFAGKVLVRQGDVVESDTVVAEMCYVGKRPFIVNIAERIKVDLDSIEPYLKKGVGDVVHSGDIIAEKRTLAAWMSVKSPVSGVLEYISPASGSVIIREKVEKDELGHVTVNCAQILDIAPEKLKLHLDKHRGEKVEKGGKIASLSLYGGFSTRFCRSPIYGEIVDIDNTTGDVVVKRPVEERRLKAFIPGNVIEVLAERGVVIETEAEVFHGVFGFGGETWGVLGRDIVVLDEPLARRDFDSLRGQVKGIIAPSFGVEEFMDLFGDELRKGITKENDTGITLILMRGFGRLRLDDLSMKKLSEFKGKFAAIDGRSQIRAGAKRPEIIIPVR